MQDWKQKRSNIQHYDMQAAIYDVQYVGEQDNKIKEMLKNMNFGSSELVLDLGCGTGFLFQHITEKAGFIVGVDVSQKALLQAKKRTKNMPNTGLVRADADNTPFADKVFDKVFAVTVLQNMPEPTKTLLEMKRASKPQAMFGVSGLKKKFTPESFVELLKGAQLKVVEYTDNPELKGHVAVCVNV